MDKDQLRKRYRAERKLLSPASDPNLWLHILESAELKSASVVASYLSYEDEPNTKALNSALLKSGKNLVLPRMLPNFDLEWVTWNGDETKLVKKGKIAEPVGGGVDLNLIDVVIVPTLHVNRLGYRLGQGGGSYDRALPKLRAWRIGLIYAGEISDEKIPIEPHDQKLDAVATPEIIVRF